MATPEFDIERLTVSPLDEVDADDLRTFLVDEQQKFWGERDLSEDHDPYWFRQLAASGLVARYKNEIVGYLLGVIPLDGPAYIHLVAARDDFRHQGIGRKLYDSFIELARSKGKTEVQATTMPENSAAVSFHSSIGFESVLMDNYAGKDKARILFKLTLALQ